MAARSKKKVSLRKPSGRSGRTASPRKKAVKAGGSSRSAGAKKAPKKALAKSRGKLAAKKRPIAKKAVAKKAVAKKAVAKKAVAKKRPIAKKAVAKKAVAKKAVGRGASPKAARKGSAKASSAALKKTAKAAKRGKAAARKAPVPAKSVAKQRAAAAREKALKLREQERARREREKEKARLSKAKEQAAAAKAKEQAAAAKAREKQALAKAKEKADLAKAKERERKEREREKAKEADLKRQQREQELKARAAEALAAKARVEAEKETARLAKEAEKARLKLEKEAEREEAKRAKEAEKARLKAEKEAEREEARRLKEEERRERDAVREAYRKAKDAERERLRAERESQKRVLEGKVARASKRSNRVGVLGKLSTTRVYRPDAIPNQAGTTRRIEGPPRAALPTPVVPPPRAPVPSPPPPPPAPEPEPEPTPEDLIRAAVRPANDRIEERYASIVERLGTADPEFRRNYEEEFDMSWIHHDSALEGVVYTFTELKTAIDPNVTIVPDSSLQPVCDEIRRHKATIDLVRELAEKKKQPITVDTIKRLYLTLHPEEGDLKTVKYRKDIPQHRLYFHEYAAPDKIPYKVRQVVDWFNGPEPKKIKSPLRVAARVHFDLLRVFPFQHDSGKVARLLMNLLLLRAGYPPAIVHSAERQRYYEALKGNQQAIVSMVEESIRKVLHSVEKRLEEQDTRLRSF